MKILVVDIGGTNVKIWNTGESDSVKFSSGKTLTPTRLMQHVAALTETWTFDRISIGYPGDVVNGRPAAEPYNLGSGWVDFDWSCAFRSPLRLMNDACMQALGSYEGGRMLYLGLGTGVGTALVVEGTIVSLALGHLQFREGHDFDFWLNREAIKRHGVKAWRTAVAEASDALCAAFQADYVVLGGGNAKKLKEMPAGCRRGGNHNAYFGGLRMWDDVPRPTTVGLTIVGTDRAIESPYREAVTQAPA